MLVNDEKAMYLSKCVEENCFLLYSIGVIAISRKKLK